MGVFDENLKPSEKVIIINDNIDKLKKLKKSLEYNNEILSTISNDITNEKGATIRDILISSKLCLEEKIEEFINEQRKQLNNLFKEQTT